MMWEKNSRALYVEKMCSFLDYEWGWIHVLLAFKKLIFENSKISVFFTFFSIRERWPFIKSSNDYV